MPEPDGPLSPDVARFLLELVNQQAISAGRDDLVEIAELVSKAKRQLAAVAVPP